MVTGIIALITSLSPAILKMIFAWMDWRGKKKEEKAKFLQDVLNSMSENKAAKIRLEYEDLLKLVDAQDDDVF